MRNVTLAPFRQVDEFGIQQCTEAIIRYYAKYYAAAKHIYPIHRKKPLRKKTSFEKDHLAPVLEETAVVMMPTGPQNNLNISELIEKLNRVSSVGGGTTHIGGKQKKRQKRMKKNLSRQLKKYGKAQLMNKQFAYDFVDEEDSAISSSSNMTSPSNSPLTF